MSRSKNHGKVIANGGPSGFGFGKVQSMPPLTRPTGLSLGLPESMEVNVLHLSVFVIPATALWLGAELPGDTSRPSAPDALPSVQDLPDPFLMNNGSRVRTPAEWEARRKEIIELMLTYEYGHMPPPPENLRIEDPSSETVFDGKAELRKIVLSMGPEQRVRMHAALFVPRNKVGPFPVVLAVEPVWEEHLWPVAKRIVDAGYIFAGYQRHDLDKDDADRTDGVHPLYPEYEWASLAVWAWGAMRMVDYLNTVDGVDTARIALTGHSRAGKVALLAGALDERIALTVPHASGSGGAGSFRIVEEGVETLALITEPERFHYWFSPRLAEFAGKEDRLPFDQHFLRALVAPRAVLSVDGLEDRWANPFGTQEIYRASQPVFDFLGAGDKNALFFRPGGHDTTMADWDTLLDFADHVFFGRPTVRQYSELPFPKAEPSFAWAQPNMRE